MYNVCRYVCIYIYICIACMCVYIYIYTYVFGLIRYIYILQIIQKRTFLSCWASSYYTAGGYRSKKQRLPCGND